MIKLVIFDLDGTLLYTLEDLRDSLNKSLKHYDLPTYSLYEVKRMVGNGANKLIERAIKDKTEYFDRVKDFYIKDYNANCLNKTKPFDGIMRLLRRLKREGVKIAVMSNKPNPDTVKVINHYFEGMFDYILGKKEENRIKPYPDGVNEIMNYFNVTTDETIMVGDSEVDIATAKNSNIKSLAVTWGYREREELEDANFMCHTPEQVYKTLKCMYKVTDDYNGIVLINKPDTWTSQDVTAKIKRHLHLDKIGHAGTLDPMATGLLIVLLGSATKLSSYLTSEEKEYECEITIGKASDTEDISGNILEEKQVTKNIDKEIDEVLKGLIGKLEQVPPMYSSVRYQGRKLYEIAREGVTVDREKRVIEINKLERTSDIVYTDGVCKFKFKTTVSKGTYIRTLCVEIGKRLGYPALMSKLTRTKSGVFSLEDAITLEDVLNDNFTVINNVEAIKYKDNIIEVDDKIKDKVFHGMTIYLNDLPYDEVFLINNGELIGVYGRLNKNIYKAKRVWN